MTTLAFSPKDPSATPVVSIDFTARLGSDTISAATVNVETLDGIDQPSMISGSPDFTGGKIVKQKIQGGTAGMTYLVRVVATTASGKVAGGVQIQIRRGA